MPLPILLALGAAVALASTSVINNDAAPGADSSNDKCIVSPPGGAGLEQDAPSPTLRISALLVSEKQPALLTTETIFYPKGYAVFLCWSLKVVEL